MRIPRLASAIAANTIVLTVFLASGPIDAHGQGPGNGKANCRLEKGCAARNQRIERITLLQASGVRPRFDPTGTLVAFDRKNADGYYDVYVSNLKGEIVRRVTEASSGRFTRNSGNPVFHPSGRYLIFLAEEREHFLPETKYLGDPGICVFCNIWALDLTTNAYTKLTDVPIKRRLLDRIPAIATVNPHFSRDGRALIWTERYDEGGHHNWGRWRIKTAEFVVSQHGVSLGNERVAYSPRRGNYVTYMGELVSGAWIVSGNLDGQHEYGMDIYRLDPSTGAIINLVRTPDFWEEDASVNPNDAIVYMSNRDSRHRFDSDDPNWPAQRMQREYYGTIGNGAAFERLTYFNDPSAPEYLGRDVIVAASDFSPNGRLLAGTIGIDTGVSRRKTELGVILIHWHDRRAQ